VKKILVEWRPRREFWFHSNGAVDFFNSIDQKVIHGPALKAFRAASATPDMTRRTGEMAKTGLQLNACINTMRAQEVTLKDLLPGFIVADKGGVVRIAELQSQGYLYLRPWNFAVVPRRPATVNGIGVRRNGDAVLRPALHRRLGER
jgi:intracellular sulfur oxidation DsrE/DsrF family protein